MKVVVLLGLFISVKCSPLVLVPGLGGTRLQGWVSPSSPTTAICHDPVNQYFQLFSQKEFETRPLCLFMYLYRHYDSMTHSFTAIPGVKVEALGVGNIEAIENFAYGIIGYGNMVNYFKQRGYVVGVNLTGFPYDFRKGDSENDYQVEQLRHLVERTYKTNEKKVTLIAHSMGATLCLKLLHSMSNDWKDNHVDKFISIAGVYGGSLQAIMAYMSPSENTFVQHVPSSSNLKSLNIIESLILDLGVILFKSYTSVYSLFPNRDIFPRDHIIIKTPFRNYTSSDLLQLLLDMSDVRGASIYSDQHIDLSPPGVEVYCIYSTGVPVAESFGYDTEEHFPKKPSTVEYGDGDGTINRVSLEFCQTWSGPNRKHVHVKQFNNIKHLDMISDIRVIEYVGKIFD